MFWSSLWLPKKLVIWDYKLDSLDSTLKIQTQKKTSRTRKSNIYKSFYTATKTSKYICKPCAPLLSFSQLKFDTSWLRENVRRTKLFSIVSIFLFYSLVKDDLGWMMVVTVYPFKKPFHCYSYLPRGSWYAKWIFKLRLGKHCEMISIGSNYILLDNCGDDKWTKRVHWETGSRNELESKLK